MGSIGNHGVSEEGRIERENRWVRQMHQSRAEAFEQMYRHYFPRLSQFVFRYVHDEGIAQDLIQNVFLGVWRNRKNMKPNGKLRSYLYTAARNQGLKYLRDTPDLHDSQLDDFSSLESSTITPEEKLAYNEFEQAVIEAVQQLPERRRQIFLMHREDDLTYREIAEVLDISIKTVETQMSRSLKFFRKTLSDFLPVAGTFVSLIYPYLYQA